MKDSIIVGLLQNTAILLALSYVYEFWWNRNDEPKNILNKILTGIIIGLIGIVVMLTPWILVPGLVFDTRSVVLSVSGLFFGKLPTAIAMLLTGLVRLAKGGDGVLMGIAVVITSGTIGMLWHKFRPLKQSKNYFAELIAMGIVVHVVMLGCSFLLPVSNRLDTLKTIILPTLTIYPVATLLLGTLMFRQFQNWQNRRAADKLRESERRFSELLKNTFLYSAIVDMQGKIIFCNRSLLEVSEYTFDEITEKNLFDIFVPVESQEQLGLLFTKAISGDESALNFEAEFLTKSGSRLLVSFNCTLLKDEDGKISGVAGIGENITKRRHTEAELLKSKVKAEESDKLKSIFLANMSHEIRTPMNSIMGFSELLGEKEMSEDSRIQYIDIIKSSSNRLLQLINDIIDLSKIEAKQLSVNVTECNLSELLANSIESFRRSELLLKKPEIKLNLNLPEEIDKVKFLSDGVRVQQVLDNLVSNAIKYTKHGKIDVGCSITGSKGNEAIEIYVKDTGIGISPEMQEIVFERFRQVEEGRYHEGAGLGLSISKGIVELLGGKIWFTSVVNIGSTFYFTIPYIITKENSETIARSGTFLPNIKGKRVLIAEDDYNSYRFLELILRRQNAELSHAENGEILLNMIEARLPDLILLDINMPVMNGFEVLVEMKKRGLNTKIIAQTAYAMPDEKERCLTSGCHGYISKPIKKEELFRVINEVLSA
jgi:PAS domain S-box-containing protein